MSSKYGISSHSLGRAWVHDFTKKLDQAAIYGYHGIELFFEDLEYVAKSLPGGLTASNHLSAAHKIRALCDERRLEIICLQPFMNYEGLTSPTEHASRLENLLLWFQIVRILRIDLICIPSNILHDGTTADRDAIVADFRELAALGAAETPVIRFTYEALCFGQHVDTWEQSWEIVKAVDRPNFGLCLDTFNIAGRAWADPATESGKILNAEANLRASLTLLRTTVDVRKVFFVQIVDAERLRVPLTPDHVFHVDGQPPRMSWSRNCRLFPFEKLGYLPIVDVLKAITDVDDGLGYTGWISLELFSRTMADPSPTCPRDHARRGMESFEKLVGVMGWEGKIAGGAGRIPSASSAGEGVHADEIQTPSALHISADKQEIASH